MSFTKEVPACLGTWITFIVMSSIRKPYMVMKLAVLLQGFLLVLYLVLVTSFSRTTRRVPSSLLFEDSIEKEMVEGGLWAPFQPGAKTVLLLSYQRTGSSFIGSALFNKNPNAFYIYEPLDGAYASMYGTTDGWNIPDDIMAYPNGSRRQPPPYELQTVRDILSKTLACDITSLPTRYRAHTFWRNFQQEMVQADLYTTCLLQKDKEFGFRLFDPEHMCSAHIRWMCGEAFSATNPFLKACYTATHELDTHKAVLQAVRVSLPRRYVSRANVSRSFTAHEKCLSQKDKIIAACVPYFNKQCRSKYLRAVKTVRASMESVGPLLKADPNLRVIHLFRDPRGAVLSRSKQSWSQGSFEGHNLTLEARVYCQSVLEDLRLRRRFEAVFPGRLLQLTYEEFVAAPMLSLYKVYDFLDVFIPREVVESLVTASNNSDNMAHRWKEAFNSSSIEAIDKECWPLYRETSFG